MLPTFEWRDCRTDHLRGYVPRRRQRGGRGTRESATWFIATTHRRSGGRRTEDVATSGTMVRITGFEALLTSQAADRPYGDANGVYAGPGIPIPLVLVQTDVGLTGVGFGAHEALERVYPAIDGQDPRGTTALYDRMLARTFKAGHQGVTHGAITAFDTALWDLKAKAADQPLWRLLGARDRAVAVYASGLCVGLDLDALAGLYRSFAQVGMTAAKTKGGLDPAEDVERLSAVAEAMSGITGRPTSLMLDANESWHVKQAVQHVSAVERHHDLVWIEEPVRRWDTDGLAAVSRGIRSAVATGENLTGLEQYTPLLRGGAADVVQFGFGNVGITEALRISTLAHAFDRPVSPVGGTMPLAHAAAAMPNHLTSEVQELHPPSGLHYDQSFDDGHVLLGDEPGIGVTIDRDALTTPEAGPVGEETPWVRPVRAALRMGPERRPTP